MDRAIGSNDLKAIGEVRRLIKRYNPDIVYGVPSNFLWTKYMKWVTRKMKLNATDNIRSILFRDKSYSWHEYFMNINGGGYCLCSE